VACGTLSNATTYSYSCFIKTPTNSLTSVWLYLSDGGAGSGANRWGVEVNLTNFTLTDYIVGNGSVTSKAVENYGNGWYRIRVTGQVTSAISGSSVAVVRKVTAGADTNGINGVLVWGAQVETGSVATSYIPTTSAAVTRNADVINLSGAVSGCIGQTEGTIYAEVVLSRVNTSPLITISDGSDSNRIQIAFASATSLIAIIRIAGANANYTVTIPTIPATGGVYKMALGYKTDDYCFALNGTAYASTASRGVPACNKIGLGTSATDGAFLNDRIRAAALYTTRLTDGQLAALTTL
jgi:hypothetical protein